MKLGLLDLSIITDRLIDVLDQAIGASLIWVPPGSPPGTPPGPPFNVDVNAFPPDVLRTRDGCQLGLYLFHVLRDKAQVNAAVTGSRARVPAIPHQPLPLQLYYILTASFTNEPIKEQQVMSAALKCFHENPFVEVTVADDTNPPSNVRTDRLVLTMEQETLQFVAQLWQGVATPLRLSAIFKVGVAFIEPSYPQPAVAPKPVTVSLSTGPAALPIGTSAQILGTLATVQYDGPGPDADPNQNPVAAQYDLSPAVAAHGASFRVLGASFAPSDTLWLLPAAGAAVDVTSWVDGAHSTASTLVVTVPSSGPDPAVAQLWVQSGSTPSNHTPFSVAARVDPAGGPVVAPDGTGLFTLAGSGFLGSATEVSIGGTPLEPVAGAPGDGELQVVSSTQVLFKLPVGIAAGRYPVHVRVNHIDSPPAKWVDVP